MARPRVFISSTFYDLRQIRSDLYSFIERMGYEPVSNESGKIPYGKEKSPEEYCYREIESCDIVVAIIGGRFGAQSMQPAYSISQAEVKTAVKQEKSLFVFVDKGVWSEYHTYLKNKDNSTLKFHYVDRKEVFEFIDEVSALPRNNPIQPFETGDEMTRFLKEQWAGMFQRFLQQQDRDREISLVLRLEESTKTVDTLVQYLSRQNVEQEDVIRQIVLLNHPAFRRLAKVMNIQFRIFFETQEEMDSLISAYGYKEDFQDPFESPEVLIWRKDLPRSSQTAVIRVKASLFGEDGKIKPPGAIGWTDDWISRELIENSPEISDDDIPF